MNPLRRIARWLGLYADMGGPPRGRPKAPPRPRPRSSLYSPPPVESAKRPAPPVGPAAAVGAAEIAARAAQDMRAHIERLECRLDALEAAQ